MTTIKYGSTFISFNYRSNLDGQDLSKFYNVIEIVDASMDVFEAIDQDEGVILFDQYEFPNMFMTLGADHTFSVCGQWHWLINQFVMELALNPHEMFGGHLEDFS